jgi:hypothetical protein
MGELGRFLEIVYGPHDAFRTVHGTLRQWRNREMAEAASGGGRTAIGRRKTVTNSPDEKPTIHTAELSFSFNAPDQLRIEKKEVREEQVRTSLLVMNHDQWWFRDHEGHVELSDPNSSSRHRPPVPGLTDIERHFIPASLRDYFVALSLEQTGVIESAGRPCIQLRAIPRAGARLWPHWLPYGAEEYEFHADPERGVLLYVAGRFAGEVFEFCEVTRVQFDESLDANLFTYAPMEGEQFRPADPIAEHLTLEAAVSRMPFTVLVPTRLTGFDGAAFEVMYHPPGRRSKHAHLVLMYRGDKKLWLYQSGTADPETGKMEWEQLQRNGKQLSLSDPGAGSGMRIVTLEQDGTHVSIMSDLDREALLEIASSLAPAKKIV